MSIWYQLIVIQECQSRYSANLTLFNFSWPYAFSYSQHMMKWTNILCIYDETNAWFPVRKQIHRVLILSTLLVTGKCHRYIHIHNIWYLIQTYSRNLSNLSVNSVFKIDIIDHNVGSSGTRDRHIDLSNDLKYNTRQGISFARFNIR